MYHVTYMPTYLNWYYIWNIYFCFSNDVWIIKRFIKRYSDAKDSKIYLKDILKYNKNIESFI